MSGHSKWATTHRQKSVTDAKRGAVFTKLAKNISVAARLGGSDVEANYQLRLAVDKAKEANMPKDNIERAVKRGTGELDGGKIEETTYEGFGPENTAFIIECLTDNRNRTSANIKHLLSKYDGNLGGPSSVSWMFEIKGVIRIKNINPELELELIDAGADDIMSEDGGVTIYCQSNNLKKVTDFLTQKHITTDYAEIEQVPKEKKTISTAGQARVEKLFNELEDDEDVNNYYTNADI
ncbi:MAG: YebC/PmpR family DNA-binding transcriptional regulator [Patescibacteria group bacterium]|nr:YebC/PmpR family DNA-binding transcriptional regulator [Patescibacteria group bacterium]